MTGLQRTSAAAALLIVGQLVLRTVLVARGDFYWDDLILIGRSSAYPVFSWDYLGHNHDGHFMPATFLVAGLTTLAAPLQWWLPALTLVALQALASLAVWRMIRIVAPQARGAALAALALYLFIPMTLPSFVWWSAGLNSLPLQAGLAVAVANTVLLLRASTPERSRPRLIGGALAAVLLALLFFEKSLVIAPIAVAAGWLSLRNERAPDDTEPVRRLLWRRGRALWLPLGAVFVAWTALYLLVSKVVDGEHTLAQTASLVWRSVNDGLMPAVAGGPWLWDRWVPSPPMATPPIALIAAGWLVLAVGIAVAVRLRRGAGLIWACAVGYTVAALIPVMWNRSSKDTALELAQTLRYLPDAAVVLTLAVALTAAAPQRAGAARWAPARFWSPRTVQAAGLTASLLLVVSSLISTVTFDRAWRDDPTGAYLATARAELQGRSDLVMFDQPVPVEVLNQLAYPDNQISRVFGRVPGRPRFATVTSDLTVLDASGRLVPGAILPMRTLYPGWGTCDEPLPPGDQLLTLDAPAIDWHWTVGLSYCATSAGRIEVRFGDGPPVRIDVHEGLYPLYFQVIGGGSQLHVRPLTPGLRIHLGQGLVGEPVVADALR